MQPSSVHQLLPGNSSCLALHECLQGTASCRSLFLFLIHLLLISILSRFSTSFFPISTSFFDSFVFPLIPPPFPTSFCHDTLVALPTSVSWHGFMQNRLFPCHETHVTHFTSVSRQARGRKCGITLWKTVVLPMAGSIERVVA